MTDQERITALEERVTKLEKLADSIMNQPNKSDIEKGVFKAVRQAMNGISSTKQS